VWERVPGPGLREGHCRGQAWGAGGHLFDAVSWGLQRPFLPQAGKTLEPSMEDGGFQAEEIAGSED